MVWVQLLLCGDESSSLWGWQVIWRDSGAENLPWAVWHDDQPFSCWFIIRLCSCIMLITVGSGTVSTEHLRSYIEA